MKKLLSIALALLLCLPMLATAAEAPLAAADGAVITVTGSASVSLKADYARVSVGVSTKADTVEEAARKNNETIAGVIAALKDFGVAEEDIVTSSYSVHAEYDYSSLGGQKLTGYNVTNQLNVIIRDMAHVGATLDQATAAGANNIYNIEFLSTKAPEAQDEAMGYAVRDACRKAELLAGAAGLKLGGVKSISDSNTGWSQTARTYASSLDAAAAKNSILPDDAVVSASVTVVFELVP